MLQDYRYKLVNVFPYSIIINLVRAYIFVLIM